MTSRLCSHRHMLLVARAVAATVITQASCGRVDTPKVVGEIWDPSNGEAEWTLTPTGDVKQPLEGWRYTNIFSAYFPPEAASLVSSGPSGILSDDCTLLLAFQSL
jgi:hypothetical protein